MNCLYSYVISQPWPRTRKEWESRTLLGNAQSVQSIVFNCRGSRKRQAGNTANAFTNKRQNSYSRRIPKVWIKEYWMTHESNSNEQSTCVSVKIWIFVFPKQIKKTQTLTHLSKNKSNFKEKMVIYRKCAQELTASLSNYVFHVYTP